MSDFFYNFTVLMHQASHVQSLLINGADSSTKGYRVIRVLRESEHGTRHLL